MCFLQLTTFNQLLKGVDIILQTRTRLAKVKHLVHMVSSTERSEVLFLQFILLDFPLVNGRFMRSLKVTRDNVSKLPSKSYELHISKSNSLNIRHLILIKVMPYRKSSDIYLSIKRKFICFHFLGDIRVTLVNIPMLGFMVRISRLPIVTRPPVVSKGSKSVTLRISLTMSSTTLLPSIAMVLFVFLRLLMLAYLKVWNRNGNGAGSAIPVSISVFENHTHTRTHAHRVLKTKHPYPYPSDFAGLRDLFGYI